MREIPLTKGYVALVDDADYHYLTENFKWWVTLRGCGPMAQAHVRGSKPKKRIYMHRVIMEPEDGMEVDHRDHRTLNNVRSNLRIATRSQNNANQRLRNGSKGVCWRKARGKWQARIGKDCNQIHLGYFATKEEAQRAYDKAAIKIFGEFALLNFPNDKEGK